MAVAPKSDLPIDGLATKNQAALLATAANYHKKHGSLDGFMEKHGLGYWPNKEGNFTVYKVGWNAKTGKPRFKSHYGRLSQKQKDRIKRDNAALQQLFGEDTFPKPEPGMEVHHKRKISQYAPFFEGATLEEIKELSRYAAQDLNAPLSNALENAEQVTPSVHSKHHNWERKQGYTRPGFQKMTAEGPFAEGFAGSDIETRKYGLRSFLTQEQPKIDANLERLKQAEAFIDSSAGGVRLKARFLRQAARVGLPALGGAGVVLGAADSYAREQEAQRDPSLINKIQAGISKVETAADAVGAIPNPASVVAEPIGFGAGMVQLGIDGVRFILAPTENKVESIKNIGVNSRL